MGTCIGFCRLKAKCPGGCFAKSKFEDCRTDCLNFNKACDICDQASEYEKGGDNGVVSITATEILRRQNWKHRKRDTAEE